MKLFSSDLPHRYLALGLLYKPKIHDYVLLYQDFPDDMTAIETHLSEVINTRPQQQKTT